jgi:hypothetical protein
MNRIRVPLRYPLVWQGDDCHTMADLVRYAIRNGLIVA